MGAHNRDPGMGTEVLTKVMLGKLLSLSPRGTQQSQLGPGCCWWLLSPAHSPPQGEEAAERVPVPSGGTSGCDAVIVNASGLIYGDEKMFPGFPQSPIKIPVPLYF